MVKASVIMAVYNGEKFVGEAIDSVLNQTFRDFEFIIVDDASTDCTASIIRDRMSVDPRIRLIQNERNLERAKSRNKGIDVASGEYLSIIDGDDISLPEKLEKQVAYLDENPDVVCVGTGAHFIDVKGERIDVGNYPAGKSRHLVYFLCAPSMLVRSSCVQKIGGYRAAFVPAEDYDLRLRVAEFGYVANLPEKLFEYRLHPASSTACQPSRMKFAAALAIEMSCQRRLRGVDDSSGLDEHGLYGYVEREFNSGTIKVRKLLADMYLELVVAAYALGDIKRACTYARKSVKQYPFNLRSWRLLAEMLTSPQFGKR